MVHSVFTIYDSVAKAYFPPFFLPNEGMALRNFSNMANTDTTIAKNPLDYALFKIGTYDDSSAVITTTTAVNLGLADKFISEK